MVFPLVQPVLKINFFVTMWDVPDPNEGLLGQIGGTALSVVMNLAVPFLAGGFREVEGLNVETELETYHPGGDNASEHHFFKAAKYPKIVFKRGVTFNSDNWDWHHQVITGKHKTRKSGTVILMDRKAFFDVPGVSLPGEHFPVAAWTFHNALPVKVAGPALNAAEGEGAGAIAVETLELQPEKIERLSLSLIPGVADLNSAVSGLIGMAGGAALAGGAAVAGALL
jgi:phage tail-like protein